MDQRGPNVTPFRARKRASPAGRGGGLNSPRGRALLVHALTLAAFAVSFFAGSGPFSYLGLALGIAAIAIALSNREDGMPWARTHHEMAVRTVAIGAAVWTLVSLTAFAPGMGGYAFWALLATALWVLVRAGLGIVWALLRKPFARPRTLLV